MAWEPDYVTVPELRSYLRIDDSADDVLLAVWATTASRAVDTFCHRQFGKVDALEARTYVPCWDASATGGPSYMVDIDDVQDVTGLLVEDSAGIPVLDYTLAPENAAQRGRPFTRIWAGGPGPLTITALWGWSAVPVPVKSATLLQASRFAARRDSPFGVAGSPSEGTEIRLLASLDPDLKTSLGSKYRREWWVA